MEVDDNNYIAQIKKKDRRALEFVVDNYGSLVYKVVRNILNSSFYDTYAEECMNDVFLAVWNNIDSYDEGKGNFKGWIAAIAKYKAIDCKRKLYKQSSIDCIDDCDIYDEINTESIVISRENREELLEAINDMKDEDREIFIRRYFLFEGIENIAKTFSVDRNLVDKRLSRGRKFLKEKLVLLKGEIL